MPIYIDTITNKSFETGTKEYPFSNIAFAFLEAFNYRNQLNQVGITIKVFLLDGEHLVYSGALPLLAMNN